MVERVYKIIFIHELAPLSPDLKSIESLWDVLEYRLYRVLGWQYTILTKTIFSIYIKLHIFLSSFMNHNS